MGFRVEDLESIPRLVENRDLRRKRDRARTRERERQKESERERETESERERERQTDRYSVTNLEREIVTHNIFLLRERCVDCGLHKITFEIYPCLVQTWPDKGWNLAPGSIRIPLQKFCSALVFGGQRDQIDTRYSIQVNCLRAK